MNVESGTEDAPFLFCEYLFRIFAIVSLQCTLPAHPVSAKDLLYRKPPHLFKISFIFSNLRISLHFLSFFYASKTTNASLIKNFRHSQHPHCVCFFVNLHISTLPLVFKHLKPLRIVYCSYFHLTKKPLATISL
jgi:hypothetical protein